MCKIHINHQSQKNNGFANLKHCIICAILWQVWAGKRARESIRRREGGNEWRGEGWEGERGRVTIGGGDQIDPWGERARINEKEGRVERSEAREKKGNEGSGRNDESGQWCKQDGRSWGLNANALNNSTPENRLLIVENHIISSLVHSITSHDLSIKSNQTYINCLFTRTFFCSSSVLMAHQFHFIITKYFHTIQRRWLTIDYSADCERERITCTILLFVRRDIKTAYSSKKSSSMKKSLGWGPGLEWQMTGREKSLRPVHSAITVVFVSDEFSYRNNKDRLQ